MHEEGPIIGEDITSPRELPTLPWVSQPMHVKPQVPLVELLPVLLNCVTTGLRVPTSHIPGGNRRHEDDCEPANDKSSWTLKPK